MAYKCPTCNQTSEQAGDCPTCNIPMVEETAETPKTEESASE